MLRGPLADAFAFGTQTTRCLFDDESAVVEDESGRDITRRVRIAMIRTGSITGLVDGATVSVAGSTYQVRRVLPADDGLLQRVLLAGAS